ncbi:transcription elongation factor, mitochondrial [Chrysoperla carnea]|uniref:transcription elongation factor, mitochondrial n=1 Tax=Chrysoperla carnea TaxID=189513 RepID=UPI001D066F9C|nr:transcription elongation factor, mitochondrial [Chrysoperla carnea]
MLKWINNQRFFTSYKTRKFLISISNGHRCQHTDGTTHQELDVENLSQEDKRVFLEKINIADEIELKRLKLTNSRIQKILEYREKNGLFTSTDQLVSLKGFRQQTINKLCKIILYPESITNSNNIKIRGNLLSPVLTNIENLKSAVGISITPNYVSWSKIEKENCHLTDWDMFNISSTASKKVQMNDIFLVACDLITKIPYGDVYIFEAAQQMSNMAQKQLMTILAQQKLFQLISMLLTLLNINPDHNPNFMEHKQTKVHFLRPQLSARLFRTLVGSERVSGNDTIVNILNRCNDDRVKKLNVLDHLKSQYEVYPGIEKDILGQSLLLNLTFMNLCVYKNSQTISALFNRVKGEE